MNTELDFSNAEALDLSNANGKEATKASIKLPKFDIKKLQSAADTIKKASIKVAPILEGVKKNFAKEAGKEKAEPKMEPKKEEVTEATNETAKTTETKTDNKKFLGMPKAVGITVVIVGGLALIVGGYFAYKKFSKK
jgi:hypothetical protein